MKMFVAMLMLPVAAAGQTPCGKTEMFRAQLAQRFNEHQVAVALVNDNVIMELWRSERGTFTVLQTGADGFSCIVSAGEAWMDVPEAKPGIDG
jgi:hypothetical protein